MKKNFGAKSSPVQEKKKAPLSNNSAELTRQQLLQKKVDDLRALHQNINLAKVNTTAPSNDMGLADDFKEVEIGEGDQHMEPAIVSRPKNTE